jgi:hypothetical protein
VSVVFNKECDCGSDTAIAIPVNDSPRSMIGGNAKTLISCCRCGKDEESELEFNEFNRRI